MYVALRKINTKTGVINPGETVPTEGWNQAVINAHVRQHMMASTEKAVVPVAKMRISVKGRIVMPGEEVPEFLSFPLVSQRAHINLGWIEMRDRVNQDPVKSPEPKKKKSKKKE